MTRYVFREIKLTGTKSIRCEGCGKKLNRQKKFYQTLNPFNRNKEGVPKTEDEIRTELLADIAEWQKVPDYCRACGDADA